MPIRHTGTKGKGPHHNHFQGVAQPGSASVLGTEGHRFKSCHLEQEKRLNMKTNRPLSPHLTVYSPQLTSTLSIVHRITGAFMACMVLFTILCLKICDLSMSYYIVYWCTLNAVVYFHWIFFGLANLTLLALCYHISNGIRHLLWDFGLNLDLAKVYTSGMIMLLCACLLAFVLIGFPYFA